MNPKEGTRHGNPAQVDDKHKELNALLDDMRDAGMAVTKKWMNIWFTAIQYAWGQQLQGWNLKEDWEYVVVNRIYPLMFQTIAKLANNNPKIMTHAWDDQQDGAEEYAERWAGHLQYLWQSPYELAMRLKLIKGLLDCAIFGYMVGKTTWDVKPRGGWDDTNKVWVGKAAEDFIHPGFFWCAPGSEYVHNAENCGTKRRVRLEWAVNRWPEFKDQIEKEAYTSDDPKYTAGDMITYKSQKGITMSMSRKDMLSKIVTLILNDGGATGDKTPNDLTTNDNQKYVDVEEIYWRDYTEKDVKIEDIVPEKTLLQQGILVKEEISGLYIDPKTMKPLENWPTQVISEYKEPLYPNGRFVLRIGRTILNPQTKEDKGIHKDFASDQVYKESRWPFTVMPYHILPHMWQGGNAIEMSRNNNDVLNIAVSSMVQQTRRTADPTKIIEVGALARDRKGNIPRMIKDAISGLGKIIMTQRGKVDKVKNLESPPLDSSVIPLIQVLKQDIDDQMFMQDVARGAAQKGQQTKAEIVRLNQNALDYVGLQGVFLDQWIDDTGTLIAEICQRNYEPGRLIKMLSDDVRSGMKAEQPMFDVRFDVNIEPGSTLPFDEQKKQQEYAAAYKMLENPIPNPMIEDMLRVLNVSKRKEILAKYKGLQLFRQFIQMGQLLNQAQTEPEVQAVIEKIVGIPGMEQLIQLLLQAGQLAPQIKGVA